MKTFETKKGREVLLFGQKTGLSIGNFFDFNPDRHVLSHQWLFRPCQYKYAVPSRNFVQGIIKTYAKMPSPVLLPICYPLLVNPPRFVSFFHTIIV